MWNNDGVTEAAEPTPSAQQFARGMEHRGGRIFTNSAVMTTGQILVVLIGLVMTPVTISYVGLALFGLWGIVSTAVSYITVIDPGFGGVVARFGAVDRVSGDGSLMARLTTLGTLAWLGIGLIFTPVMVLFVHVFSHHIHVAGVPASTVASLFYWGYGFIILEAIGNVLNGQLIGTGALWLSTIIDVSSRLVYAGVLLVGVLSGAGLWALVLASFAQALITLIVTFCATWKRLGFPYGDPRKIERSVVRDSIRFGGWTQVTGILDTLTYGTDSVVIGTFVSPAATGVYAVAGRLARQIPFFANSPQATLPAMSAAFAAGEGPSGMARMAARANRLACLLGAAIATMILGCAPILLVAWLGRSYPQADLATCIIAFGLLVGIPRQTGGVTIYAMGRVGYGARARVLAFVVNLVVTLALVMPFGMPGVLIGTLLATITSTAYLQLRVNQLLGITAWTSTWNWAIPLACATVPAIVIDRLAIAVLPASTTLGRGPAITALIGLTGLNYLVFVIGLRLSRFLTADDVRYVRRALPGPVRRLARPWMVPMLVRGHTQ
ncbi:MAG: oligosaccharide flippase family protein [Actinomycetes bacterium]